MLQFFQKKLWYNDIVEKLYIILYRYNCANVGVFLFGESMEKKEAQKEKQAELEKLREEIIKKHLAEMKRTCVPCWRGGEMSWNT